jgi:hypothetical protein
VVWLKELFMKMTDSIVEAVKKRFTQRSEEGIRKYGTTLERRDLDWLDWITHLQEELMDAVLYIERLKEEKCEQ